MAFIVGNEVLSYVQHGFRANKSTATAFQFFVESTHEAIEDEMNPLGIFLYLTKACDVLNHTMLLSKLNSFGIRGVACSWFESYLSHQRPCMEINNMKTGTSVATKWNLNMEYCRDQFSGQYYFCYT